MLKLAEATAANIATRFAIETGFWAIQVESDSQNVVNAITHKKENLSMIGGIVDKANYFLV